MFSNVYIVESPLQLLSATEAAQRSKVSSEHDQNILIVRFDAAIREKNNQQMKELIDDFSWDEVVDFTDLSLNTIVLHIARRLRVNRFAARYAKKINNLYIGEFRSEWMHYIRHAISPRNTFLLDDGAVTIQVQREYLAKGMGFPQLQKRSFILRLAHKIIYFGVRQRSILNEPIHLFTSFNLESLPNQQVTRHGYEYLKASYANKAQGEVNEIWFFGSKYSEAGILSESDELALFNEVITKLSDLNFTVKYIPHRDESEQKLERFRVKTNVEILRLEVPAEIQLIQGEVRPKAIAGYYTTVLLSCAALQPTIEIYSFKIPSNLINGNYLPSIQNVYSFFKQAKLKVIDLSYQRDEHSI